MKKYMIALLAAGVFTGTVFAQAEKAEAPTPFIAKTGVVMGPVLAIDAAKREIIIGEHILKISQKDVARLKVGDEVTVEVNGRKVKVLKEEDKKSPRLFNTKGSGVAMGPVSAIDAAKNEIMIGESIIKLSPKDIAGLMVGDDVTVEFRNGKTTVRKTNEKTAP